MICFRKSSPIATVALVGVAMLALAAPTRAGFTLTLKEGAITSGPIPLVSGTLNTYGPVSFGSYTVTVTASDSAPGLDSTFGGALVSQNTFSITSSGPGADPLEITVQDDTFDSTPYAGAGSVALTNSLSTTLITSGTVTSHGFFDSLTTADIALNGPSVVAQSISNSISGPLVLGSTFTLGNYAKVTFTGSGNQQANFTVTTVAPVPEPSTVVAALTALPLGIGVWMRRRRQMA